jgi:aconitate hydratase 2/2-methylisocitrate dehydratase
LIAIANNRIEEIKSGTKPALTPDANAKYFAEVVIDLDIVAEPMIADPDVNNADVSKRYARYDSSAFTAVKKSRSWFCRILYGTQGDLKILSQMLKI